MTPVRRLLATATALTLAVALSACGGTPSGVVTVTSPPATGSPTATGSAAPRGPVTDDKGRTFDFGRVARITKVGDTQVLALDRWTDPSVDDSVLAQKGLPVKRYPLKKPPYRNVNTTTTFRVPVRDGTMFLLHHCLAADEPLQSRSVDRRRAARRRRRRQPRPAGHRLGRLGHRRRDLRRLLTGRACGRLTG